ncbi:MAG: hypothetical protein N2053_07000 [Chitinispirillaceae bacterium]|nr:hypothetical protein [Chitinispirillaceae bacterium]
MKEKEIFRVRKKILLSVIFFIFSHLIFGENNLSRADSRSDKAISIRNNFFFSLLPDTADIDITQWADEVKLGVKERLETTELGASTWGLFIRGILAYLNGETNAEAILAQSVKSAEIDPSTTWLLFVEFDRYNIPNMIEKVLIQLEKQMFIGGGRASSFISRQLLHYGFEYKKKGDRSKAAYYFTWSHRFCRDEILPLIQKSVLFFPSQLMNSIESLLEAWNAFSGSWKAQLHFFFYFYSFIRKVLIFFVIIVFLIFSVKYLPSVLHHPAHLYPVNLSPNIGVLLLVVILISVLAFGFLPLLWILAFLLKPALTKSEKGLFVIAVIIMALLPMDSFLYDRLYNAIDPEGPIMKLSIATEESGILDGENCLLVEPDKQGNSFSSQLSKIFCDIKKEKFSQAGYALKKLSSSYQSDGIVQNLLGIVYFLSGETDSAAACFKRVREKFTKDYVSQFNLARCYIVSGNIANGMEILKSAAEINSNKVNGFIETNDQYFGNKWPNLRQVMFPEFTPQYFWKKIFFASSFQKGTYKLTWGISFLGISPIPAFILFVLLLMVLFVFTNVKSEQMQPKKLFECKYCGRILCRKCSAGMVCSDCANEIISPRYSENIEKAKENIGKKTLLRKKTIIEFFNAFLPLTGNILKKDVISLKTIILILLTSLNCVFWLSSFYNFSFYWLSMKEIVIIIIFPSLFTVFFLVKYLPSFMSNFINLMRLTFTKER